ncbi:PREDICTED: transcription factor bHLH157 isoform X2 [Camelina sativa]|uniref:Transcription factor bHLH157 isoform X2 n=1 Tax=Camelina sativa TaxID=90675 RepID=A0ABM0TSK4_CAMSA|nr:PREDICTED: transcription factor bHLH157 isoform X2 [Camelina sativa]
MGSSEIKQILKSLCFSHGWSYAVFWRYDPINSMLLSFEEAYNDVQSVALVDDMILKGHVLGQGTVGEVALTGVHQWLFSDTLFQCEHEFQNQFLSGFKTIAIIPVGSRGVLQFGSVQKIVESPEMLEQTTRAMQEKPDQSVDLDTLFESLVPLGDCEIVPAESFQGLSFDDIFADDSPPSLLSPENEMISCKASEAASASSGHHQDVTVSSGDDFGFDILKSYTLDDLYELLADSPEQNCSSGDDHHHQQQENSMVIQGNDDDKDLFDILGMHYQEPLATPPKGLFSELISSSLSNNTCTSSLTDYSGVNQSKRRKLETSSSAAAHSSSFFPQAQETTITGRSLWIDDERSSVGGVKKKRAKAGESRRPRPKDRQMIQDRIKELRGMIPNGAKCSIDTLLDLTIKHMEFMQSLAKYADRLKQPYESKLVKEKERTWAVEVGDDDEEEAVVCPIIVEDMNRQGEMQIEMVCEERGEFLEIGDVVRGLGLKILKGVMETRKGQIWAHMIVQANNPQVTRHQVFYSLVELFQHQHHQT